MAKKENNNSSNGANHVSSPVEELLLAALERNDNTFETGRYLATFKEGVGEDGTQSLATQGMRVADARDFSDQAAILENIGDADAVVFPEIGVALLSGNAAQERNMSTFAEIASDSPILSIDPEYFVFADNTYAEFLQSGTAQTDQSASSEFLRGFLQATETITKEMRGNGHSQSEIEEEVQVLGATWGVRACRVPASIRSGMGIKVAVLDTGFDLGHPDFLGRPVVGATFVGQPVQDLHSHGTHCIGTACGPRTPAGTTPRYGIGFRSSIFVGKVLSNSGSSVGGSVLAGMNWAIANRCQVISMSLGGPGGPHPAYTAAGQAALTNGCLIIAAAGNNGPGPTGAPANSPTIMSVASLDSNLQPSSFSARGKIDIAAPGRDIFSSVPRPVRYGNKNGTSMATPHVAGCAALWAETSPNMRGRALWQRLQATARRLPFPASQVGAGLVQAP
ncbi:S8 family serine peptidase [Spirosoma fluviale]|uniref:Subtilase family protein n=1 Tax=Spirosoma fluviale TaxID=1597977 RepID=A0A286G4U2_9BACT|nr:S8 family serine peptidase [Spirosoma fluviale]SOD90567.1 Subtilase family protein [Spirosoma fluviale]